MSPAAARVGSGRTVIAKTKRVLPTLTVMPCGPGAVVGRGNEAASRPRLLARTLIARVPVNAALPFALRAKPVPLIVTGVPAYALAGEKRTLLPPACAISPSSPGPWGPRNRVRRLRPRP